MIVFIAEFIFNDHFSGCHKEINHYFFYIIFITETHESFKATLNERKI
jgi:hypothetical protein